MKIWTHYIPGRHDRNTAAALAREVEAVKSAQKLPDHPHFYVRAVVSDAGGPDGRFLVWAKSPMTDTQIREAWKKSSPVVATRTKLASVPATVKGTKTAKKAKPKNTGGSKPKAKPKTKTTGAAKPKTAKEKLADLWAGAECTLDGVPAKIQGRKLAFAKVSQLEDPGESVEFSWEAVNRVMTEGDEAFSSGKTKPKAKAKARKKKSAAKKTASTKPRTKKKAKKASKATGTVVTKKVKRKKGKRPGATKKGKKTVSGGTLASRLNWLDRAEIQEILERWGFAVYDSESTDDLREALQENIEDGTIPEEEIDTVSGPKGKKKAKSKRAKGKKTGGGKSFKEGDRVRVVSPAAMILSGIPEGAEGTVRSIAGAGGRSVYPDPAKRLVYVEWDQYPGKAIGRGEVEKIGNGSVGRRTPRVSVDVFEDGQPVRGSRDFTQAFDTVGALPPGGWNEGCGYETLADWLHASNDRYYEARRHIADLAMDRAEELAAIQYPLSAKASIKKASLARLQPFITEGKHRMKRTGEDGKAEGEWYAVVRTIQQNILSSEIIKAGGRTPQEADVRCAGLDLEGVSQAPCPAYTPATAAGPAVIAEVDVDEAYSVGDEDDVVYYSVALGPDGYYLSAIIDSTTGAFVDSLVSDDGPYTTEEDAIEAGLDLALGWLSDNEIFDYEIDARVVQALGAETVSGYRRKKGTRPKGIAKRKGATAKPKPRTRRRSAPAAAHPTLPWDEDEDDPFEVPTPRRRPTTAGPKEGSNFPGLFDDFE